MSQIGTMSRVEYAEALEFARQLVGEAHERSPCFCSGATGVREMCEHCREVSEVEGRLSELARRAMNEAAKT